MEEGENSFSLFAILGFDTRASGIPDKCSIINYISSPSETF